MDPVDGLGGASSPASARWSIDPGVARDLAAALGWSVDDGVAALVALVPVGVPCGSTAKLAAMATGEVPPGADAAALARLLLDHLVARATGLTPGGAPSPAWSCWVTATVTAALVETLGLGPAAVTVTRRTDERAPVVDFHAAVVVDDGSTRWMCDPYFGLAITLPDASGADAEVTTAAAELRLAREADAGWAYRLRLAHWEDELSYRLVGPSLDPGDVRAMCAISATHSGVPSRPYARLHRGAEVVDVRITDAGEAIVGTVSPPAPVAYTAHATWAGALDDFAARTGVRIV